MKKSIGVIFFFSMLLLNNYSISQSCDTVPYQHIFYNRGYHETFIKNFSFTSQSDLLLIGFVNENEQTENTDGWLMRTTFHGTPLWSKAIGTPAHETINGLQDTKDGGFIFVGDTKYNSLYETGWIGKIDSSGNPEWSVEFRSFNGSLSQVAEMDNGDIVVVGTLYLKFNGDSKGNIIDISKSSNFIMRLSSSGKLIWQRSFYHGKRDVLNKIQTLRNGNLLVAGNDVSTDTGYIIRMDQNSGKLIWMNEFENTGDRTYARITENEDGTLEFNTDDKTYYFTPDGNYKNSATRLDLKSDGVTLNNVQISDLGAYMGNEIYFANIKHSSVLFSIKNNSEVQWAHVYNAGTSNSMLLVRGRIFHNNIYLSGSSKADKISDDTLDESMAYLLKASGSGDTYCSDSFNIEVKISSIPADRDVSFSWADSGFITEEYISMYSKDLEPVRMLDCSQQTCCNDVVITRNNELCNNTTFKLPDGNNAAKPGFYTSRFTTLTGCDSIIYTHLSQQKKIDLFSIHDTCLVNSQPVTFVLNNDSSIHYRWQNGTTNDQFTAFMPGEYWVTAISSCDAVTDSVKVFADCAQPVFIPSAFTPNNDGLNDIFHIPEINGQHLTSFNIYNRFGQLIFHSENTAKGWDGTKNNIPQPSATYIYVVRYFDLINNPHLEKGTVTLIR